MDVPVLVESSMVQETLQVTTTQASAQMLLLLLVCSIEWIWSQAKMRAMEIVTRLSLMRMIGFRPDMRMRMSE